MAYWSEGKAPRSTTILCRCAVGRKNDTIISCRFTASELIGKTLLAGSSRVLHLSQRRKLTLDKRVRERPIELFHSLDARTQLAQHAVLHPPARQRHRLVFKQKGAYEICL